MLCSLLDFKIKVWLLQSQKQRESERRSEDIAASACNFSLFCCLPSIPMSGSYYLPSPPSSSLMYTHFIFSSTIPPPCPSLAHVSGLELSCALILLSL